MAVCADGIVSEWPFCDWIEVDRFGGNRCGLPRRFVNPAIVCKEVHENGQVAHCFMDWKRGGGFDGGMVA